MKYCHITLGRHQIDSQLELAQKDAMITLRRLLSILISGTVSSDDGYGYFTPSNIFGGASDGTLSSADRCECGQAHNSAPPFPPWTCRTTCAPTKKYPVSTLPLPSASCLVYSPGLPRLAPSIICATDGSESTIVVAVAGFRSHPPWPR